MGILKGGRDALVKRIFLFLEFFVAILELLGGLIVFWNRSKSDSDEVSRRLDKIESDFRLLRNEWNDFSDKLTHMADRIQKRQRKLVVENEAPSMAEAADLSTTEGIFAEAKRLGMI